MYMYMYIIYIYTYAYTYNYNIYIYIYIYVYIIVYDTHIPASFPNIKMDLPRKGVCDVQGNTKKSEPPLMKHQWPGKGKPQKGIK